MEVVKEYWLFLDETNILAVFETLQECLEWKPSEPVSSPRILRIKKLVDGSFRRQMIPVSADIYR